MAAEALLLWEAAEACDLAMEVIGRAYAAHWGRAHAAHWEGSGLAVAAEAVRVKGRVGGRVQHWRAGFCPLLSPVAVLNPMQLAV